MRRFSVIFCALPCVALASGFRVDVVGSRTHSGSEHLHHAHTHHHDGDEHSHLHSHTGHGDHSQSDSNGDHHDELSGHDHGELPLLPPPVNSVNNRQSMGKILVLCQTGILCEREPRALVPPKPPPRRSPDEDNLLQLRTVILLT